MIYRKRLVRLALIVLLLASSSTQAEQIKVAVAANFTDVARDLAPLFEKHSGHRALISFGSTGKLYSQIENGAPFQVFLAADTQRPKKAEQAGLAVAGSLFTYAQGKLVLWSATPNLFGSAENYLKQAEYSRLAIANPKTAPYGLAARQVLEQMGLYQNLFSKLVRGDSIAQTFQFVATSNAESGFVAHSQVKSWRGEQGSTWVVPESYYQPIAQAAVLLKKGEQSPAAKAFMVFLRSAPARQLIADYGYGVE